MNEAILILPNMRGGCATVGNTVHTLFRVTSRLPRPMADPNEKAGKEKCSPDARGDNPALTAKCPHVGRAFARADKCYGLLPGALRLAAP